MSVLIEAHSVVVRIKTVAEKYPGGVEQYIKDCPNKTLCMDKDIICICFMNGNDGKNFIISLEKLGFRCVTDGELDEIAVVDQFEGCTLPCDWLEFSNSVTGEERPMRISACKLKGAPVEFVSYPDSWDYEKSVSKHTWLIDLVDGNTCATFIKRDGNVEIYRDNLTGEEVYCYRTVNRNLNS